jgi:hypothetical protein
MFDALVKEFFDGATNDLSKKLLHELEGVGKDLAKNKVSEVAGRVIVKGIDDVVAAAVKVLDNTQTDAFTHQFLDGVDMELAELVDAIRQYVPLQVAVEVAKHKFGTNSKEANAARAARVAGIAEVKEEVGDIFASVVGGHVKD